MRLKEVNNATEPPHPDMPDEHPKVLLQMEEKLNQAMGLTRPDKPTDQADSMTNSEIPSSLEFEKMDTKEKEAFRMRFMEAKEKEVLMDSGRNKIQAGSKNINYWWHWWSAAPLVSAWASSVYTYRWWWWSHSYPATNVIYNLIKPCILKKILIFCIFSSGHSRLELLVLHGRPQQ
jgi:hypothetical protein